MITHQILAGRSNWIFLSNSKIIDCVRGAGTSKWNRIEHRMFCHITANWRGRPLSSLEVIVNLIAGTRTEKGSNIQAAVDLGSYEKGIEVSDEKCHSFS